MPFGAEFRCDHCGVISVLIIDRALVPLSTLQKQGEKVCIACGRTALREARFCQEGHKLVRACTECQKEFAVDHQRCDYCGQLQDGNRTLKSPIDGTFYRGVVPDASPIVEVGAHVKKGQVVCIIETMCLKNEIECDWDGEVVAIHVDNAQPVKYCEPLFTVDVS
jgi:acetyl-CoA carboxylase biotin carboxyl carrier protein